MQCSQAALSKNRHLTRMGPLGGGDRNRAPKSVLGRTNSQGKILRTFRPNVSGSSWDQVPSLRRRKRLIDNAASTNFDACVKTETHRQK